VTQHLVANHRQSPRNENRTQKNENRPQQLAFDFGVGYSCFCFKKVKGMYSVSQKNPPEDLWQFFKNGWGFINQILHTYYAFLSTLKCEFLFNYLQL